ncbi:CdaR family protein [Bacillus suaedaesalsae]|uniref:YbbR-like domain-containing protein n=1 Tax=Bacillus suaedaesalsae TaxID=2810349 RepID=A0ABS2DCK3_9BACI|nr:CdaR family protein [Bacillus suaedaesalsae]MBM6616193.1 YbbR-like domain-containing protein [Bacillus suaedaesalsae]
MDKFMDNHWVVRVIALLFALMLYTSVNMGTQSKQVDTPFSLPLMTTENETLTEIPLSVYYDRDNYVVSGLPQTVNVTLEGPRSSVQPIKLQRSIEPYIDLEKLKPGTHELKVLYEDINDSVKVTIDPAVITLTIHEKVEKEFSVEVDYIHELNDGYALDEPIVNPKNVKVIGAKEQVEQIALVKAIVDLKGADEKIKQEAPVAVYDSEGNRLAVEVVPAVVDVEVSIISPNKVVPISFVPKGKVEDGYSLIGLETAVKDITIFGAKKDIDKIQAIENIEVDVEGISESTTIEVEIPVPKGLKQITPTKIPVQVTVEKNELQTITNLPIKVIGIPNSLKAIFLTPAEGVVNIEIVGAPTLLKDIDESDFDIYIDVNNLGSGEHKVDIQVNGPEDLNWTLATKTATVQISNE